NWFFSVALRHRMQGTDRLRMRSNGLDLSLRSRDHGGGSKPCAGSIGTYDRRTASLSRPVSI
ncbi:MAG: hypothetical protein SPJ34_01145, partial [Candidatus Ornithospirochaeta sp.]|nr:hypothetical protein [Candidatus Ornithospirochaeta sp.]